MDLISSRIRPCSSDSGDVIHLLLRLEDLGPRLAYCLIQRRERLTAVVKMTAELKAFKSLMPRLKECINPNDLLTKCYSKDIISKDDLDEAEAERASFKKANVLLQAVEKAIKTDPENFKKFLNVLGSEVTNKKLVEDLGTHMIVSKPC